MAANATWRSKLGNVFPRAEVEKLDTEHHRKLKKLRSQPGNDCCAECGAKDNTWSSVNLGVFLCVRCADVHRALGTHISKVKGCGGTYLWGPDEIAQMQSLGNRAWSTIASHIDSTTSKAEIMRICRMKYENKPLPTSQTNHVVSSSAIPAKENMEVAHSAPKRITPEKAATIDAVDLDSFMDTCLRPSQPVSQALVKKPTSSTIEPSELDRCFAPAPPSQGVVCRSISGFDFDNFFDECLRSPSASAREAGEKLLCADTSNKHEELLLPIEFESCLQVTLSDPKYSEITVDERDFDSNAFFDEMLGSNGSCPDAAALKMSSVVW